MDKESGRPEGACALPGCDAYGQIVFDPLSFGIVNINRHAAALLNTEAAMIAGASLRDIGCFLEADLQNAVACCRAGCLFYCAPTLPASPPAAARCLAVFGAMQQTGQFLVSVAIIPGFTGEPHALNPATRNAERPPSPTLDLINAFANGTFDFLSDASALLDADGSICQVNLAFSLITGYDTDEIAGKGLETLLADDTGEGLGEQIWADLASRGEWEGEIPCRKKNGELFTGRLGIRLLRQEEKGKEALLLLQAENAKPGLSGLDSYRSQLDPLTGLPNRLLFFDRLSHAIRIAERNKSLTAILFIDLDRFKWVNDTFGHVAGDELLQEVAMRLCRCVRQSDTVARLGGDEFTVILAGLSTASLCEAVAQSILFQLAPPFLVCGQELHLSCSIGISVFPENGGMAETLLKNADAAMYQAKQKGRNRYQFFTQDLNAELEERSALANELQRAFGERQLRFHYQPIVNLQTGRVVSAEALLRWQHHTMGWVPPEKIVRIAELSGLTKKFGTWAVRTVCRESRNFLYGTMAPLPVSVNTSSRFFRQSCFLDAVQAATTESGLPAGALTIEVREKILLEGFARLQETIAGLKGAGAKLWVDDFGTDYASLSGIVKHPLDALKIDGTLIHKITGDRAEEKVVEAIVLMAHRLGVNVIAEGVETERQFQFLRAIGCDHAQGYFFCRPLPADDFASYLGRHIFAF